MEDFKYYMYIMFVLSIMYIKTCTCSVMCAGYLVPLDQLLGCKHDLITSIKDNLGYCFSVNGIFRINVTKNIGRAISPGYIIKCPGITFVTEQ